MDINEVIYIVKMIIKKSFCKKVLDRFINPAWAENSVDEICA